jgi:tRNA dimethylallyltransferase
MTKPDLHIIGGPTASGKTAVSLELAGHTNGVIINADAMQVYKGLPVLTAQPSLKEREDHLHVLFEVFGPEERSSAGRWLGLARKYIYEAADVGLTPIVVGGTGFYFSALLGDLAEIPDIPDDVRESVICLYEKVGHDAFREELSKLDQQAALRIKPNDRQRLVRALEVVVHTGKTLRDWQQEGAANSIEKDFTVHRHLLLPPRETLYAACDLRFLRMIEQGALEEVRTLLSLRLPSDLPVMKILGVPELAAHLRGELSLDAAIAKAQQFTRNYAKRQVTWFKNRWEN